MPISPRNSREFPLSGKDFQFLSGLLKEHTGIDLSEKKIDLLYSRLVKRIRVLNLNSFRNYIEFLESPDGQNEMGHLVNALTTNLTRFLREPQHFEHMQKIALPDCLDKINNEMQNRLRIWSAGCASGEEAYSIALTLRQSLANLDNMDVRILATDLDTDVLAKAADGVYPADSVNVLPFDVRRKLAAPLGNPKSDDWRIQSEVGSLIVFKVLNLMSPWPMNGPFDIIFCRNVMIYFDRDTTNYILSRFAEIMRPGGWLYIGHSENILDLTDQFVRVSSTTYQRTG